MIQDLIILFERDLDKLAEEIRLYQNEENLWKTAEGISNSGGNLALHLSGNLKHFIGAKLGNTGYVRERDKEFSLKNILEADLLSNIEETKAIVVKTLSALKKEDLEREFEFPNWKEKFTVSFWLIHLSTHLNYHLGQVNYHRRLLDS